MWPIIVSGFFEPLFFLLVARLRARRLRRGGRDRRRADGVLGLRRARAAGRLGYERRLLRPDEHLLEDALPEALRLDSLDAARARRTWRRGRPSGRCSEASSTRSASSSSFSPSGSSSPGGRCWRCRRPCFVGFAFAGAGIAAVTYMRSWQDFDILNLAISADVPVLGDLLPALGLSRTGSRR